MNTAKCVNSLAKYSIKLSFSELIYLAIIDMINGANLIAKRKPDIAIVTRRLVTNVYLEIQKWKKEDIHDVE